MCCRRKQAGSAPGSFCAERIRVRRRMACPARGKRGNYGQGTICRHRERRLCRRGQPGPPPPGERDRAHHGCTDLRLCRRGRSPVQNLPGPGDHQGKVDESEGVDAGSKDRRRVLLFLLGGDPQPAPGFRRAHRRSLGERLRESCQGGGPLCQGCDRGPGKGRHQGLQSHLGYGSPLRFHSRG